MFATTQAALSWAVTRWLFSSGRRTVLGSGKQGLAHQGDALGSCSAGVLAPRLACPALVGGPGKGRNDVRPWVGVRGTTPPQVGTSAVTPWEEPPWPVRPGWGRSCLSAQVLARTGGSAWAELVCLKKPQTCRGEGGGRIFPLFCLLPELFPHLSFSTGVSTRRVTVGQLPRSCWLAPRAGGLPEPLLPKARDFAGLIAKQSGAAYEPPS